MFVLLFYYLLYYFQLLNRSLRNHFYVTTELDSYFYDFHVPAHLNSGNYLIGIFFGYTYYEFKKSGGKHYHKTWLQVLWHLSYLSTFFLSLIGIYFYENDIEKGFVSAILGAIFKHIYGPAIGITIVGIFLRYGHSMPKIFNYGMYRVLARLSFSVFMVHITIGWLIIAKAKYPVEMNNSMINAWVGAIYLLSHCAALFLVLCLELPAHVLFKIIANEILGKPKISEEQNHTINNGKQILQKWDLKTKF